MNYLSVEKISKSFGEKSIFSELTFGIDKGQKVALVAKNGTGKTTLLNCLIGKDHVDLGRIVFRKDISYDYMRQDDSFDKNATILDEVLRGGHEQLNLLYEYNRALEAQDENLIENLINQITDADCWNIDAQVKQILSVLKLDNIDLKIGQLSGGQKKRIALAKVLLSESAMLFLDEPTNHLDLEMIEWLEN